MSRCPTCGREQPGPRPKPMPAPSDGMCVRCYRTTPPDCGCAERARQADARARRAFAGALLGGMLAFALAAWRGAL